MRVQDLDSLTTANSTDELVVTNPTIHKSWRQTLSNFAASIKELFGTIANLEITTLLKISGALQLVGATITGDADIAGDVEITGDLEVNGDIIQRGSAYETHAEKVYTKDDKIILRDGAISALGADDYAGMIAKHYDTQGNDGLLGFNNAGEARVGDYTTTVYTVYSSDGVTFYTDAEMTTQATIPAGVTPTATGTENEYTYSVLTDDTEPLLTRDEVANMTDKAIAIWDAAAKKVKTAPVPTGANLVPVSNANGGFSWGNYNPDSMFIVSNTTLTGKAITSGASIRVYFTADIAGSDTSTALVINYNTTNIPVKVGKDGSLVDFVAHEVATNTYKYIQANTAIELLYDGTNFIILGNPIVLSSSDYTIYANGFVEYYKYEVGKEYPTGEYWTDGKPIYKRVYNLPQIAGGNTGNVENNVTYVDTIISTIMISGANTRANFAIAASMNGTTLQAYAYNGTGTNAKMVMKYTKTTG